MARIKYSEFVDRIDIDAFEDAIEFVPVDTNGENDIGHCPDVWGLHKHGDTTGKFAIHRGKKLYNCWVCGGGSLLSLVMEMHDMDAEEATEYLYEFAHGDTRSDSEFVDEFLAMIQDDKHREETLPYFNPHVLDKYKDEDTMWWGNRGIPYSIVKDYGLRYVKTAMKKAPIRQRKDGPEKIDDDYYGPAAIFPHFWEGKLVGWQNRWLNDPDTPKWLAKYTNTVDFPKSFTLFNYDMVLHSSQPVVVCESVPTVLMLASIEVPAVSYFGGTIKEPQLRLLRRLNQGVILAPDNDGPGEKFLEEATPYLERYIPVYHLPMVDVKEGADLGDLVTNTEEYQKVKAHLDTYYTPSPI